MSTYHVHLFESNRCQSSVEVEGLLEVGRQDHRKNDPEPMAVQTSDGQSRLIIADKKATKIPRLWFRIEPLDGGGLLIRNLHQKAAVPLAGDAPILPQDSRLLKDDFLVPLGEATVIRIEPPVAPDNAEAVYRSLNSVLQTEENQEVLEPQRTIAEFEYQHAGDIARMLRQALDVVQKAGGTDAFYEAAAEAAAEIVGLDRGLVLIRHDQDACVAEQDLQIPVGWQMAAQSVRVRDDGVAPGNISSSLLRTVVKSATTVLHDPLAQNASRAGPVESSLTYVDFAVASPILDSGNNVVGVLYGDRRARPSRHKDKRINDLEATIVDILASAVAGGISRRMEERWRTKLSEFFSPRVSALLESDPTLMNGQDAEISVLFCDIRGFSSVMERLDSKRAIEWINDVMTELSQSVIDQEGVLVDYVGDELFAMWGAPGDQPDHAKRAAATAQEMLLALNRLRQRWNEELPLHFGAGIGIHTGDARVGNVGSRHKFKYGPIGNAVNLGSRLQSATKQLGVECLASRQTMNAVDDADASRRLTRLTVVGMETPVEVFELVANPDEQWLELKSAYEDALQAFENQRFHQAAQQLGAIMPRFPDDRPTRLLLARTIAELDSPSREFDAIWQLPVK